MKTRSFKPLTQPRPYVVLAAALFCCWTAALPAASHAQQAADDDAPFGDLLEGLDPLAAPPLPKRPAGEPAAPAEAAAAEDAAERDPLAAARAAMQRAGQRLQQGRLDAAAGRDQQLAIEQLDRFLAAMQSQQPSAPPSPSAPQPQSSADQQQADDPSGSESAEQPGASQPAEDPTMAGDRPGTAPIDSALPDAFPAMPADLDEAVWGHLPERMRRQLQAAMPEEFLPEYREAIRDYFQRLTELPDDGP